MWRDSRYMPENRNRQPGDIILDRYVPHLSPQDREVARARLYQYAAWHLGVIMRQLREEANSRGACGCDKLDPAPHPP